MENLSNWYSIALSLSDKNNSLHIELEAAEKAIEEIESSMATSQARMLELLESDTTTLEELNMQEQHLQLLARLLYRKRAALVKSAAGQCLKHIRNCNVHNSIEYEATKDTVNKVFELLEEEKHLPKAKVNAQIYSDLYRAIADFPRSFDSFQPEKRRKKQAVC